ncbi:MAG: hypothetical protein ACOC6A_04305 [Chloroflexota bacterium]
MSTRRKRRAEERRLARSGRSSRINVWTIIAIGLAVLAIGLARSIF